MLTAKTPIEIATSLVEDSTSAGCITLNGVGINREPNLAIRAMDVQRIRAGVAAAIEADRAQLRAIDAASAYSAYLDAFAGSSPTASEPDVRVAVALGIADKDMVMGVRSKADVGAEIAKLLTA